MTMSDAIYTADNIRTLLRPVFDAYNVSSAILFGSYAKGNADDTSDVDILVDSGLKGLRFFGLLEGVTSALEIPVDMIDVSQIDRGSEIEQEILKTGVRIYGQ